YWLMAVSSLRSPLLRYSMTLGSPCMAPLLKEEISKKQAAAAVSRPIQSNLRAAHKFHLAARLERGECSGRAAARAAVAGRGGPGQRLVHDAPDGARAAGAMGAASEADVELGGRARCAQGGSPRET